MVGLSCDSTGGLVPTRSLGFGRVGFVQQFPFRFMLVYFECGQSCRQDSPVLEGPLHPRPELPGCFGAQMSGVTQIPKTQEINPLRFNTGQISSWGDRCPSFLTQDPSKYVAAVAAAGASGCTFHIEVMSSITDAVELASQIRKLGMVPGVALAPDTDIAAVLPLIQQGAVDLVRPGAQQGVFCGKCTC